MAETYYKIFLHLFAGGVAALAAVAVTARTTARGWAAGLLPVAIVAPFFLWWEWAQSFFHPFAYSDFVQLCASLIPATAWALFSAAARSLNPLGGWD